MSTLNMIARHAACWRCLALCLACLLSAPAGAGHWGLRVGDPASGPGALITAVLQGGPATQAGLQPGDLITHAEGRKVLKAGDLATLLRSLPEGQQVTLTVTRQGWEKNVTLVPGAAPPPAAAYAGAEASPPVVPASPYPPPEASGPLKATVAVGDFQVKAARANQVIGDGLREMLLTALHNSGRFIVVERIDIKGIAAEQALSRSAMARPDMAIPGAQMDVADVMVNGAVTEFEGEASGSDFQMGMPSVPFTASRGGKTSHMAIDIRVVDVRSGRLLMARRISGAADSSKGSFGASPTVSGQALPFSFGAFRNTPMEKAIRDAVIQATQYVADNLPSAYFRHP
jgi:curli biogenesis system outer membrane secretion channel CsgG